jgi:hypothetical protein
MGRTVGVLFAVAVLSSFTPALSEDKLPADPEALVEQLADKRLIRGWSQASDEKTEARIERATQELIRRGTTAFPALIAHRNDQRFSHKTHRIMGNPSLSEAEFRSTTVGAICVDVIVRQVNPDHSEFGPDFIPDCVPVDKLPEWWSVRSSKSFSELHREAVEWTIAAEKRRALRNRAHSLFVRESQDRISLLEAKLRETDR